MMINSCSYTTNDLVLIKFSIFNQDLNWCLASTKYLGLSFEAITVDSRARASRSHQVLKEESNSWINFQSSQDVEEVFQEEIFKT